MATTDDIPVRKKDPNAVIDFEMVYRPDVTGETPYLESDESILTSTWAIDDAPDADLVIAASPAPSIIDGERTKVWLTGGTVGVHYRLRNRIVTDKGRTDDRSMTIAVQIR